MLFYHLILCQGQFIYRLTSYNEKDNIKILIPEIEKTFEYINHEVIICVTAQQREMLDQSLDFFEIIPDYDLNIMEEHQDIFML